MQNSPFTTPPPTLWNHYEELPSSTFFGAFLKLALRSLSKKRNMHWTQTCMNKGSSLAFISALTHPPARTRILLLEHPFLLAKPQRHSLVPTTWSADLRCHHPQSSLPNHVSYPIFTWTILPWRFCPYRSSAWYTTTARSSPSTSRSFFAHLFPPSSSMSTSLSNSSIKHTCFSSPAALSCL